MHPLDYSAEIQSITKQLVEKYRPQRIILFGSSAINKFNPEKSDLDFLIVKDNVPHTGRSRIYELDKLINYNIAADFIVYTQDELKYLIDIKDPFITTILKEGKKLYG